MDFNPSGHFTMVIGRPVNASASIVSNALGKVKSGVPISIGAGFTTILQVAVNPPDVAAVSTVSPIPTPTTLPLNQEAILVSSIDQVTSISSALIGKTVAETERTSPMFMLMAVSERLMLVAITGALAMVTSHTADAPFAAIAVITAVPVDLAVTTPESLTTTIVSLSLLQRTVVSVVLAGNRVASSVAELPGSRASVSGMEIPVTSTSPEVSIKRMP